VPANEIAPVYGKVASWGKDASWGEL
jgi:hypothetical protein